MTDIKPKFDIEKLNLHYGAFHALKDINMQISAHEITAFIGPSGCGKSTFLKTLNRMNDLVENVKIDGKVELDGQNIFKDMDAITLRHKVGMVFQQPNPTTSPMARGSSGSRERRISTRSLRKACVRRRSGMSLRTA